MKLLIEVDKKDKRLFMETAKAVHAKVEEVTERRPNGIYMTEEQEDAALLKLMEEGRKEGRMGMEEQKELREWIKTQAETAKLVEA